MITPATVFSYLLEHGYVTAASAVDGDFRVTDLSRRNRSFRVSTVSAGYVVKQARKRRPGYFATLDRESDCYWLAQNDPDFAPIAKVMPRCWAYDASRHVLILELLSSGENLEQYHGRIGKLPVETARLLGDTLGAWHSGMEDAIRNKRPEVFPAEIPWMLSADMAGAADFESVSEANRELLRIIGKYETFGRALEDLRTKWVANTLIHGDLKWDHCILVNPGDPARELRIVDWEFADIGDGCWDAGAVLQAYLHLWVQSVTDDPLEEIQPAIRAFWQAYAGRLGATGSAAADMLERSVGYAALRMIQTARENLATVSEIGAEEVRLLQVSQNILASPKEAVQRLFGS